jgi:hypothetical protein
LVLVLISRNGITPKSALKKQKQKQKQSSAEQVGACLEALRQMRVAFLVFMLRRPSPLVAAL